MTDSIKPPGGPPSTPPIAPTGASGTGEGRFREALDGASEARPAAQATPAPSHLAAVVAELRSGAITAEAAIGRLVEHHLGAGPARALAPAARAELEHLLRGRLEADPTFRALTADLERAR